MSELNLTPSLKRLTPSGKECEFARVPRIFAEGMNRHVRRTRLRDVRERGGARSPDGRGGRDQRLEPTQGGVPLRGRQLPAQAARGVPMSTARILVTGATGPPCSAARSAHAAGRAHTRAD